MLDRRIRRNAAASSGVGVKSAYHATDGCSVPAPRIHYAGNTNKTLVIDPSEIAGRTRPPRIAPVVSVVEVILGSNAMLRRVHLRAPWLENVSIALHRHRGGDVNAITRNTVVDAKVWLQCCGTTLAMGRRTVEQQY